MIMSDPIFAPTLPLPRLEWQVIPQYGKCRKITEIEYKMENGENSVFEIQNKYINENNCF